MRQVAGVMVGVAIAGLCCVERAGPTEPSPAAPQRRFVVVTHTTGFRHPSIHTAEAVLGRLAAESGISLEFCRTQADIARLLIPSSLSRFDGVLFANTTGNLGIADLPAFLAWIRDGHSFVGTHSASDTYHDAPEFLAMLGAEFDTHGNETTVDIQVEDRTHPATAALENPFRVFDEIYEFRSNPRGEVNVLLSLDRHPTDGHSEAGQAGDFPLAWYRPYGNGRVFYTALGHRDDVWNDRRFQRHLIGGMRWAVGLQ